MKATAKTTPAPVPQTAGPSLEERVNDIRRSLTLIHASTQPFMYEAYDGIIDTDDLFEAIRMEAFKCLALIEPLIHASEIADWQAPAKGRAL